MVDGTGIITGIDVWHWTAVMDDTTFTIGQSKAVLRRGHDTAVQWWKLYDVQSGAKHHG